MNDEKIANALRETKGNVAAAASRLGMGREDVDRAVRASAVLSAIIDGFRSELVDFAETKLRNAVAKGEDWAIRYVLDSARAMPRGWRKSQAAPGGGTPGRDAASFGGLSDDQLAEMNRQVLEG